MLNDANMALLVDAGNSRVKFGWLQLDTGKREPRALALAHGELDGVAAWLASLPRQPAFAVGVNVAGDALAGVIETALKSAGIRSTWLASTAEAAGIINLYDSPSQLGPDRWISLIGLGSHTDEPALLASFGTATTVDLLGGLSGKRQRRFEGGVILPGPELMRRSLANGTANLPYAEGSVSPFPRHTHRHRRRAGGGVAGSMATCRRGAGLAAACVLHRRGMADGCGHGHPCTDA